MQTTRTQDTKKVNTRLQSIDVMRGLVMVIMALDHVREYWGPTPVRPEDLTQASVILFFTRWVTHLCAPTFVFLSGLSVYLYQQKSGSLGDTRRFLLTRGVWLLFVEAAVISFIMVQGYGLTVLSVIWVIGCSMIVLAGAIRLPRNILLITALAIMAGHHLLPTIRVESAGDALAGIFYNTPFFFAAAHPVLVTYTIIPWVAVMMLGYGVGPWYTGDPALRNARLMRTGFMFLLAFVIIRAANVYGDPSPWVVSERGLVFSGLSFVNVTKYPPSLLFLALTLGVCFLLLRLFNDNIPTTLRRWLSVYGQVPFFFFVLHFAVISVSSLVWTGLQFGQFSNLAFSSPADLPAGYQPSLTRVYVVWVLLLALMYFPCRWFSGYRRNNDFWWLKYL